VHLLPRRINLSFDCGLGRFSKQRVFARSYFEMFVEILLTFILFQLAGTINRLIERRRDVLYYVARARAG
jgi:hypothetical protein